MRFSRLAAALLGCAALLGARAAHAQTSGCPAPNPNLTAPPFISNCPLPAASLNRLAPLAAPSFTGTVTAPAFILTGNLTVGGYLSASPAVTWSGSGSGSAATAGLWMQETVGGSSTASNGSYLWGNQISATDNFAAGGEGSMWSAWSVHDLIGASATGSRNVSEAWANVVTRPADSGNAGTNYPAYVSSFPHVTINTSLGGTGITDSTAAGGAYGINPNVLAGSAATNLYDLIGGEFNVTAQSGSSVANKVGIQIVQGSADAVRGAVHDYGLYIGSQAGAVGWTDGIQVDAAAIHSGGNAISLPGFAVTAAGHVVTSGSAPALSACGTGPAVSGNDISGYVIPGSGAAACTITFAVAYATLPHCPITVTGASGVYAAITTLATTAITVTPSTAFNGTDGFTYVCMQ
jgi:hypothetical protein